jgi:hypothetical protein
VNFDLMFIVCCMSYLIMYSFHFVAECTPGEAFSILGEKVIFASGSPFHDVDLGISLSIRSPCDSFKKKLGRGGKDRPPGIKLRRERNMVSAEKIPEPWPSITSGTSPHTLQRPSRRVVCKT